MMPNEGRVAMLRALCEKPMLLYLFTKGPAAGSEFVTAEDFQASKISAAIAVQFRDWMIDEEKVKALADKKTFKFTGAGEKIPGWCLVMRQDKIVVGYDYFPDPYPINSKESTVSVRPSIALRNQQGAA